MPKLKYKPIGTRRLANLYGISRKEARAMTATAAEIANALGVSVEEIEKRAEAEGWPFIEEEVEN